VSDTITIFVDQAGDRYAHFLNILRSQVDVVMRRGPTSEMMREEARGVADGAARHYAGSEQGSLNDVGIDVANEAWVQARTDLGLEPAPIPEHYHLFIFESMAYAARLIAAQADRDVVAMAQHIRNNAIRIDMNTRAGASPSQAAAAVMLADAQNPSFRFQDRIGRNFKSSKHIRDTVRQSLRNIWNEVYMDAVFDHGHETVRIMHPDPNYEWFGEEVSLVSGRDIPTFYDIRDEVFHPSSDARLTIIKE
jgi:hypothetical protein